MTTLTLEVARKILDAALAKGVEKKFKPLVITILDVRGAVKVTAAQDGTTLLGAVGVSGDTSDNDEICAIAGIEAAGLRANPG